MRKIWQSLSCFFLLSVLVPAFAITIDRLIVFGDSTSDNGNLYRFTEGAHLVYATPVIPKNPPYYQGRFSNGPVWVENLAQALNVPLDDYAYGGAWVEPYADSKQMVPFNLSMQIDFYLVESLLDFNRANHLYVISAGANDYTQGRSNVDYATTNTVNTMQALIEGLIVYGAKNFLILNLPDLSYIPEVTRQGPEFAAQMSAVSQLHDQKFTDMVNRLVQKYKEVKFISIDLRNYYDDIRLHPEKYALKNVSDSCYSGGYFSPPTQQIATIAQKINLQLEQNISLREAYLISEAVQRGAKPCVNPDEYLFWDHVHPSRVVHRIFAKLMLNELHAQGIEGKV